MGGTRLEKFHAHIYYEKETFGNAQKLVKKAYNQDGVVVGRMHEKPIGPHPKWSCQLLFSKDQLTNMMILLLENRKGLTVFIHPVTGKDFLDHTEHAIWLGEKLELNLEELQ